MTKPKAFYRRRRVKETSSSSEIPLDMCRWFAGEASMPWAALLPPTYELVPAWWAEWKAAHADAVWPADAPAEEPSLPKGKSR